MDLRLSLPGKPSTRRQTIPRYAGLRSLARGQGRSQSIVVRRVRCYSPALHLQANVRRESWETRIQSSCDELIDEAFSACESSGLEPKRQKGSRGRRKTRRLPEERSPSEGNCLRSRNYFARLLHLMMGHPLMMLQLSQKVRIYSMQQMQQRLPQPQTRLRQQTQPRQQTASSVWN